MLLSLSVNLACVKVGDEETKAGGEGMFRFPEGALLAPDGVSVIAQQATTFSVRLWISSRFRNQQQ